jgi:nucleotide-binding universal stress UspA family protein
MFKHLLVPLDGSRMSESALPAAAGLAARTGASLTLVHVIEKNAPAAVHSEKHLVDPAGAAAYLAEVARRPLLAGLRVETHVHTAEVRDVAASITQHTEEMAPDLVVMSTHGRGGARRLIFGAIAQQVIALGATPVLLVRPSEKAAAAERPSADADQWRTILAPLDGDPDHEKGLPLAAELAVAFSCRLHLLMVTPTLGELAGSQAAAGMFLPGATRIKLEMDSAGAEEYLAARAKELEKAGVQAGSEASRGDPAVAIVKAARRLSASLVVMSTHGRAGTDAFWTGSVAARVVARASVPLLLVPLRA